MRKKIEEDEVKKVTKEAKKDIFLDYAPYLIIIFFVIIIRIFIATPVNVSGSSMEPTLKHGDYMILYKLVKHVKGIKRFDIVVVNTEEDDIIKRVIGLPNDKIKYEVKEDETGKMVANLYINDELVEEDFIDEETKLKTCKTDWNICNQEYTVPEGEYYVLGDNRGNSTDSRIIGSVKFDKIEGITNLILFPFNRFGKIN